MATPWVQDGESLLLRVRVTPRGGRDGIDGIRLDTAGMPALALRVAAPPSDGAANKAVLSLVARTTGARKSDVTLIAGGTAREKRVRVTGDPAGHIAALEALLLSQKP